MEWTDSEPNSLLELYDGDLKLDSKSGVIYIKLE
jgi:hypothetical protein